MCLGSADQFCIEFSESLFFGTMDKENNPLPMNGQELNNPDESQVLHDVSGEPADIPIAVQDAKQDQKEDDILSELHTDDEGSVIEKKFVNEFRVSQKNRDKAVNALIGLGNVPPNEIPPTLRAARSEVKKLLAENSKLARQAHLYHDIRMQAENASAEFTKKLNEMRVQLSEQSTELITMKKETSENLIELQGQLAEERMRALAIDRTLSATQDELREANRSLTRMTTRHTESENRVTSLISEVHKQVASKERLREECSQVKSKTSTKISELKSEKGELSDALGRAKETIRTLTSEMKDLENRLKSRTSDRETLRKQVETLKDSLSNVQLDKENVQLDREKERTKQLIVQVRMESKKANKLATDAALKVQVDKEKLANRTSEKIKQLDNVAAHKAHLKKKAEEQEEQRVADFHAEQERQRLAGISTTPTAFPVRDDNGEVASVAASALESLSRRRRPSASAAGASAAGDKDDLIEIVRRLTTRLDESEKKLEEQKKSFSTVLQQTGNLSSLIPEGTMVQKKKKKKRKKTQKPQEEVDPRQQTLTQMPSMKKKKTNKNDKETNKNDKENNKENVIVTPPPFQKDSLFGFRRVEEQKEHVPEVVEESAANVDVSQLTETIRDYYGASAQDPIRTDLEDSDEDKEEDPLITFLKKESSDESSEDDAADDDDDDDDSVRDDNSVCHPTNLEIDQYFATGHSPASD